MWRRGERGQVVVEYAIVFPIQLLMTLAIIQLAHVFVAKQIIGYAAFCGARAEIVGESAEDAATLVLSRIAGTTGAEDEPNIELPGWGEQKAYGAARKKTKVEITKTEEGGVTVVRCDVVHDLELLVPVGNYIAYRLGDVFLNLETQDDYGAPHIAIPGSSTVVRPWSVENEIGEPESES